MKLPESELDLENKLKEFDTWITPSLQEIQDSDKYKEELDRVDFLLGSLGAGVNEFSSIDDCSPESIASTCVDLIEEVIQSETCTDKFTKAIEQIDALSSLLFMVTGKSDNNLKCQFPVYLSQEVGRDTFPHKTNSKKVVKFTDKKFPREIKSDKLAKLVSEALVCSNLSSDLAYLEGDAKWLLGKYVSAILKDDDSVKQFWSLVKSYFSLKSMGGGFERSLMAPIVIFKVRGSVSASGGHIPEDLLRGMMDKWGMESGVDYNLEDVILRDSSTAGVAKTRAYDFVLPYMTEGWEPHIFIQCQFYAGDSGSVSHKVVDQTQASRPLTLDKYPHARFIEYLDGAGYYSSLNTDLRHMLGMATTKEFIQVRSAHLKLRRELQCVGFLTPLEIEHAVFRSAGSLRSEVVDILASEGYPEGEISRAVNVAVQRGVLISDGSELAVNPARVPFSRRLLLMDLIAVNGESFDKIEPSAGRVYVSGYGDFYGIQLSSLSEALDEYAPNLQVSRNEFAQDMDWLVEERIVFIR